MNTEVNRHLLTSNGNPLNFYLDGFDIPQFLETAAIIRKFGGNVTPPNSKTVVLAMSDCSSGIHQLRFHVDWLYDSMTKGELQDIGKYLLPAKSIATGATKGPSVNETSIQFVCTTNDSTIDDKKSSREQSNIQNDEDDSLMKEFIDTTTHSFTTPRMTAELEDSDTEEEQSCVSSCSARSSTSDNDNPPPLSPVHNSLQTPSISRMDIAPPPYAQMDKPPAYVDMNKLPPYVRLNKFSPGSVSNFSTPRSTESSGREKRRTLAGARIRSCCALSSVSRRIDMKPTSVRKSGGKINLMSSGSSAEKRVGGRKSQGANSRRKSTGKQRRYSLEEEKKIIKYLIDENCISQARKMSVSKRIQSSGLLPNRTIGSINSHMKNLSRNIRKFSDDPDVIGQFESLI